MSTKKNTERSHLEKLLSRIGRSGDSAPTSIIESERPDFILKIGTTTVGVETTRAVEGEYVRAEKLQDKQFPSEAIIITNLRDTSPRRSNEEIVASMFDDEQPWKSIEIQMTEWLERIGEILGTKRVKLNVAGFQLFDENWLLIYDWPPLANDDLAYRGAVEGLTRIFTQPCKHGTDFDAVFVLSGRYLFGWREGKLILDYDAS